MSPDGTANCPLCDEKIGPSAADWRSHVDVEKDRLMKAIEKLVFPIISPGPLQLYQINYPYSA